MNFYTISILSDSDVLSVYQIPTVVLAAAHYGLHFAVSRLRGPPGAREVLREPINPLCPPPEQCYGQQSHTSWRLSHRRLQLLRTTPCSPRRRAAPFPCRVVAQGPHVETLGDEVKSVIWPLGFTCHIPLKERKEIMYNNGVIKQGHSQDFIQMTVIFRFLL